MKKEPNNVTISARIPKTLKKIMETYTAQDAHLNESDLIRDAVREKIQREAPELFAQLFKETSEK
ncbi:MAG: ribbon-helix-helix domain-containing protein [Candidatus Bathyarchaeota archaeon]|nr:ribbon-helix-helix domain-containing protein [Candidatus Bathyarchaeota archaeon]